MTTTPALIVLAASWALWFGMCFGVFVALRYHARNTEFWVSVAMLTAYAAILRTFLLGQYPSGWNQDEVHFLADARQLWGAGVWAVMAGFTGGVPALPVAVFQVPIGEITGSWWWAMRWWSLAGGILSVPLAMAFVRLAHGSLAACVVTGTAFAALPWCLLYSRTSQGGHLIAEVLVVCAGVLLVWSAHRRVDIALGMGLMAIAGLWLLLDYYAGRCVSVVVALSAVGMIAHGQWRRGVLVCVALGLAIGAYATLMAAAPNTGSGAIFKWAGLWPGAVDANVQSITQTQLMGRLAQFWQALTAHGASHWWMSGRGVMTHPLIILQIAALAVVFHRDARMAWITMSLAVGGAVPALWGGPAGILSTHRMIPSVVALPLALGMVVGAIPRRAPRLVVAAALAAWLAYWGPWTFFSPRFWDADLAGSYAGRDAWGTVSIQ